MTIKDAVREQTMYVKLPRKYKKQKYLDALDYALYRLVFVSTTHTVNEEAIRDDKEGGITTRITLNDKSTKNFADLQKSLGRNNIDTMLFVFNHIQENQQLYFI